MNDGPGADDCRQVLHSLYVFLDGECATTVERTVLIHLRQCTDCLGRADFERELRAVVATRCRDVAPAELVNRVVRGLHEST